MQTAILRSHTLTDAARVLHLSALSASRVLIVDQQGAAVCEVDDHNVERLFEPPQDIKFVLTFDYHNQTCMLITDQADSLACNLTFLQIKTGQVTEQTIDQPEHTNTGSLAVPAVSCCASNFIATEQSFNCIHSAVSLYQDWVHVFSVYEWCHPQRRKVFLNKYSLSNAASQDRPAGGRCLYSFGSDHLNSLLMNVLRSTNNAQGRSLGLLCILHQATARS